MKSLMLATFGTTEIVLVSVFGAILVGIIIYYACVPFKSFLNALFSGCYIPSFKLINIKNRKFNVKDVVDAYILAKKSGKKLSLDEIETLMSAGGNVKNVINAMNFADNSGLKLDFKLASSIEISSGDVMKQVQDAITSRVVEVDQIKGFAKDNQEMVVSCKFSIKLNLNKYISGLGEEDLKNNVRAWLMENISKTSDHNQILSEPNQTLLSNLDLRVITLKSRYDLIDINILSVDLGRDLNAENDLKSAEKEKIYAQIEAERRKNAEEIKEIQTRTKTEEMKSNVLKAEAEVPEAISQAIKEGRFSVMDYYKLMNLQADTALRRSIINDNKKQQPNDDDEGDLF